MLLVLLVIAFAGASTATTCDKPSSDTCDLKILECCDENFRENLQIADKCDGHPIYKNASCAMNQLQNFTAGLHNVYSVCSEFNLFRDCLGQSMRSCTEYGWYLKNQYPLMDAKLNQGMFTRLIFQCGAGLDAFLNNNKCMIDTIINNYLQIRSCDQEFNRNVEVSRSDRACTYVNEVKGCYEAPLLASCGVEAGWWGCEIKRLVTSVTFLNVGATVQLWRTSPNFEVTKNKFSKSMKIVAIGAAPTSLGLAYRINELKKANQAEDVELVILEQSFCEDDEIPSGVFPGGLSCTVTDDKGFLWDMGGHITFSHNFPYYEKATREAVGEWNDLQRQCLVDMNYLFDTKGIPQFAVPLFPEQVKQNCLDDLKERYENTSGSSGAIDNFEDWIMAHFDQLSWTSSSSHTLAKCGLWNQRKCLQTGNELAKADFGWGPNATFSFPKYGGTGAVWKSIAEMLPQEWLHYNCQVTEVDYENKQVKYRKGIKHKKCAELNIAHNQVFIIGVGLKLPMPEFCKTFTWLYFPDQSHLPVRYGEVTPDNQQYWSVMCECAKPSDDQVSEEEIRDRAIEGLILKSIIKREQIVSLYSTSLPYGYPIPTVQRDAELARAHRALEKNSIYSRGRFGGWKYEVSNQDHCFIQGKELADRLVLNEPEKLYKTGVNENRVKSATQNHCCFYIFPILTL
uniref:Uncharacterized protein n=1 Tax=Ditylenchus dipsaci TaxID=166011 RepID=A0A915E3I9_9BILA